MEDEEDLMSVFGKEIELNYDEWGNGFDDDQDEDDDDESLEDKEKNIKPIEEEDDSPEEVDGAEDDDSDGDDSGDESSPNIYSSLAGVLLEQGVITTLESSDKVKTTDDLVNVFNNEINVQANLRLEEHLNNLDLEKIAQSKRARIELDSIDEDYLRDNLEVAKEIIYRDLLNQGLSEDRAKKLLRKTVDLGEDVIIEDALESKGSLGEYERRAEEAEKERYKEELAQNKLEQERVDNAIKSYIYDSKEIVKGIPNTKALQEAVYKSMNDIVGKNATTGQFENKMMKDRSVDPIKFDTRMYYFYELTNGFTELGKIQTNATSKATKNLERALRKTNFEDNGTPGYMQDPNSYGGTFGSELVI